MLYHSRIIGLFRAGLRLGLLAALMLAAHSLQAQSIPGFLAPEKPKSEDKTPDSLKAAAGQAPLNKIYGHLKLDPARIKQLPVLDPSEIKKQSNEKRLPVGVVRSLASELNPISDSTVYPVVEGEIRVSGIVSTGAFFTRVHFKGMSLPARARVFVYSMSNPDQFCGPYENHGASEDGTFWTPPMKGDGVIIEYFVPAGTNPGTSPFTISEVSHVFKDATDPNDMAGTCNVDVPPAWQTVAKSVGMLDFVSGDQEFLCTGTLLNDQASDQIPYLLTANHCFSTPAEAQSLRVFWNYDGPPTVHDPPSSTPTTDGSSLIATGTNSDFTLVRLTGSVPGGLFFSGWDSTTFSGTISDVKGIHHPNGDHKKMSSGNARQPVSGECGTGFQCFAVDWIIGDTEGGSSGSGIWKGLPSDPGGPRLIGALKGGPSGCGGAPTDQKDFYGRFSVTFPDISSFLMSCVTSISGTSQSFGAGAGAGSFTVTAPAGCTWKAVSSQPFVTVTSNANGTGNLTVGFSVQNNAGPLRNAQIIVGSQVFTITQSPTAGPCTSVPILIGETRNASLATGDCDLGDVSFVDSYSFNGMAGEQISVAMNSSAFDTYLYLLNPDGSLLTFNDDLDPTHVNTNSRMPATGVIVLPTTGSYTILANSFQHNPAVSGAYTLTLAGQPLLLTQENSNNAVALDSVTHVAGPFKVADLFNFSSDQHTRLVLFTSDLGLNAPNASLLTVTFADQNLVGHNLTVENVGPFTGGGLNGSYVIVRLPDGLPAGNGQLTFTVRGQTSNPTTLTIAP